MRQPQAYGQDTPERGSIPLIARNARLSSGISSEMISSRINLYPRSLDFLGDTRLWLDMRDIKHIHILTAQSFSQFLHKPHELKPTQITVHEQIYIALGCCRPLAVRTEENRLSNPMPGKDWLQALFYFITCINRLRHIHLSDPHPACHGDAFMRCLPCFAPNFSSNSHMPRALCLKQKRRNFLSRAFVSFSLEPPQTLSVWQFYVKKLFILPAHDLHSQ